MVVDDQALVRAGFAAIVDAEPDPTVVGEAGDGATAVSLALREAPDLVLMDIRMPGTDGLTATRLITALETRPRVLVLTTFDLDAHVYEALRAGASGFLLKDARPEDLLSALRIVASGEAVLAPAVTAVSSTPSRRARPHRPPSPAPSADSPRAKGKCCSTSPRVWPTPRSRWRWASPPGPSRPMSRRCSPSWDCATGWQATILAYESGLIRPGGAPAG